VKAAIAVFFGVFDVILDPQIMSQSPARNS
jgi:hypothetical protein